MGLRIRKSKKVGPARLTASKKNVSASTGKGRVRVGVSKRGIRGSIRILPGISWRWRQ